jgi:hypothetical protein
MIFLHYWSGIGLCFVFSPSFCILVFRPVEPRFLKISSTYAGFIGWIRDHPAVAAT